jgi:ketosteroid isomerase-like protein
VRFPKVAERMWAAVLRLPTSSRLRREIFARAIRDNADAYARRDYDAFMVGFDPEIVIDTGDAFPESNVYEGLEGMRRFLAMVEEVWQDYVIEPEEVVDVGDRYALVARHRGHGRSSGAGVDTRVGLVGTFRGGMVVRLVFYGSPAQALEAVGLRTQA